MEVVESFGGLPPNSRTVEVLTANGGGDCGVPFVAGERYLIEAFRDDDGRLRADICSATRRLDAAGATLRVLRQRRDGKPVPSLAGQIALRTPDSPGRYSPRAPQPLANILVRLRGQERVYETRSDPEGLFAFYDLPQGEYEFAPELPPGTVLARYLGSGEPPGPFELRVGASQERDIWVYPGGSIHGRILDESGQPLPQAQVYIVPASGPDSGSADRYWESQGKDGFYKFLHLPPGAYLIVVNPDDAQRPEFPYRRTFYPGVRERAAAGVVQVSGAPVRGVDIRLERSFRPRHVRVRVSWSDGRLIRDAVFVNAKATQNAAALAQTNQRNPKESIIELDLVPGEPYEIEASLICRYVDEKSIGPGATLHADKLYFTGTDERTELTLTIPATRCPEVPGKTSLTDQPPRRRP